MWKYAVTRSETRPLPSCPQAAPTVAVNGVKKPATIFAEISAPADDLIALRSKVRVHAWPASAKMAACTVCRKNGQVPRPRCGRAIGHRYSAFASATWLPANVFGLNPRRSVKAVLLRSATLAGGDRK